MNHIVYVLQNSCSTQIQKEIFVSARKNHFKRSNNFATTSKIFVLRNSIVLYTLVEKVSYGLFYLRLSFFWNLNWNRCLSHTMTETTCLLFRRKARCAFFAVFLIPNITYYSRRIENLLRQCTKDTSIMQHQPCCI